MRTTGALASVLCDARGPWHRPVRLMPIVEGTKLGAYRIVRKVGEGGMGAVYEGIHQHLQKRVAIKTLHEHFARDASAVARFAREGRAASRIRHPHVIDITDVGMEDGTPYLVMEMLEGESLAGLVRRTGPLSLTAIADIALPVLDALSAAHAAGIVHRDLKPENVFLATSRGAEIHPMVLDFGISCIEDEVRLTKTAQFMGTPYYMSPEQAESARKVDARSDQFSLGLVLFELVTAQRALSGSSVLEVVHRVSTEGAIRLGHVRPDLPYAFTSIVDRMTERIPTDRFPSMREAGAALLPFASPRASAVWGSAFAGSRASSSLSSGSPGTGASSFPSVNVTHDAPQSRASFATPASSPSQTPSTRSSFSAPAAPQRSFTPSSRPPSPAPLATDPTVSARASAVSTSRSVHPTDPGRATEPTPAPPARSPVLLAVVALTGVLGAVGVAFLVGITLARQPTPETQASPPVSTEAPPPAPVAPVAPRPETIDIRLRAVPATAEIALDGAVVANGSYARSLPRDGIPHVLEVRAPGYIPHHIQFLDIAPIAEIVLEPVPRHHHGPIEPRRSAMTEAGLVAAASVEAHVAVVEAAPVEPAPVEAAPTVPEVPPVVEPARVEEPSAPEPPPVIADPVPTAPPPTPADPDGWEGGETPSEIIPFPTE